jgi:hypothetical protein
MGRGPSAAAARGQFGDWREQQRRWGRLHCAHVAVIVTAFVLTLAAGAASGTWPTPRSAGSCLAS